ncbi:MAG: hypothetical protein GY797_08615 [Deltaproteobacteria bacterium]|nr:hypothetical protein [Deltaproteobacteria bacterium]
MAKKSEPRKNIMAFPQIWWVPIVVALIGLIGIIIPLNINNEAPKPQQPFTYSVRVQTEGTGKNMKNVKVTIEVSGQAPLDEITDTNGFARIFINASYIGKPGRLLVEASGYESYRQEIDLSEGNLPDTILLTITPTPTSTAIPPSPTNTLVPPPTHTPTAIPPSPTNTLVPPPTPTPTAIPPSPTNTPVPPPTHTPTLAPTNTPTSLPTPTFTAEPIILTIDGMLESDNASGNPVKVLTDGNWKEGSCWGWGRTFVPGRQSFTVLFSEPRIVHQIGISDSSNWDQVKEARVTFGDNSTQNINFRGLDGWEFAEITPPITTDEFTVTIIDTYPGKNLGQMCILEVQVKGY